MNSSKFDELFGKLNPEQKKAVETIEGPVMVLAGPGTGKTQVLILRIANILLKTQADPSNILVLTFTEHGAVEVRRRLGDIIGQAAHYVNIFTFHGFCNDIIKSHPQDFPDFLGSKNAHEIEQINLVKSALGDLNLKLLSPFGDPHFYVKEILRSISNLKREAVGFDAFLEILEKDKSKFESTADLYYEDGKYKGKMRGKYVDLKKKLDKNFELQLVYKRFEEKLRESKLYDYDDMILEVVRALSSNQELLLSLQEKHQYILIDEHQDTNNAQNKVVELLASFYENPNLFVVGDVNQAIFRFQGATLENFLYFKNIYKQVVLVTLKRNYRSTQNILDSAHSLINGESQNLVSELGRDGDALEVYEFNKPESELYFLAKKVLSLTHEGVPKEQIAIIYRDNRDAFKIAEMLSRHEIPYKIESNLNILEDRDILKLTSIFKFLDDMSEEKLFTLLHIDFLGIAPLAIYKINTTRGKTNLLEFLSDQKKLSLLKLDGLETISSVVHKLLSWHQFAYNSNFIELFEEVVRDSGFLKYILSSKDSLARMNRLDALFREVKYQVENNHEFNLKSFINYLNTLELHGISIREKSTTFVPDAVRLMTSHGSKGLEFDYVFICNASYGHWGGRRHYELIKLPSSIGKLNSSYEPDALKDTDDEERRLFYVALTRARKNVFISYAVRGEGGREQFATQFISTIKPEILRAGSASKYESELDFNKDILFAPKIVSGLGVSDRDYLQHLFVSMGLSATSLNNFLTCPWKYFYVNLVRIPKASSRHQMYGKAIHAGLMDFFNAYRTKRVSLEFLLTKFEMYLGKESLLKADAATILERGKRVLSAYFANYDGSWINKTKNEFRINGVYLPNRGGEEIKLTGSLDKIEYLDNGEINPHTKRGQDEFGVYGISPHYGVGVNVVDYKTGHPKSRNDILGKTENSNGDYYRQLVFYKLLTDMHPAFFPKMTSGEIDFIEADQAGKFRKEKFIIGIAEVEELRKLIYEVANKITNFTFWNERCSAKDCEYCVLRETMG